MSDVLTIIGEVGLVPVVKIDHASDAVPLGRALLEAGLPVIEITFRTSAAEQSIKNLKAELPELLIGAGTVLTKEQVDKAHAAGAQFIVSPGFNPTVADHCISKGIPITPGISSPSQIEAALEKGLTILKYFPAESIGGIGLLTAMAAPYGGVKFIPTGGISQQNIGSYLSASFVHACGGSWMVKSDLITAGNFKEISRLAQEAVNLVLGFDLAHIGINTGDAKTAQTAADLASLLFGLDQKDGSSSVFSGKILEFMKVPFLGKHGHIAIATNNIGRAVAYFKRKGVAVKQETAKEKNGKTVAIYLDLELAGFAVHLLQK